MTTQGVKHKGGTLAMKNPSYPKELRERAKNESRTLVTVDFNAEHMRAGRFTFVGHMAVDDAAAIEKMVHEIIKKKRA